MQTAIILAALLAVISLAGFVRRRIELTGSVSRVLLSSRGDAPCLAQPHTLDANSTSAQGAVWVQVALEGDYLGYDDGRHPFSFSRQVFDEMVDNLHNHPSFNGRDGVVAWDYNHASERDPTSGSLPQEGSPAPGWTVDLAVRTGADGRAELWSLTQWSDRAREYIQSGAYKWCSVAVQFNDVHPVTGQNRGAVLRSIGMTNQPFVQGMQPLVAASMRGFGDEDESPQQTIDRLRRERGAAFCSMSWDAQFLAAMEERHQPRTAPVVAASNAPAAPGRVVGHRGMYFAPDGADPDGLEPAAETHAHMLATRQGFARLNYDEQWQEVFADRAARRKPTVGVVTEVASPGFYAKRTSAR